MFYHPKSNIKYIDKHVRSAERDEKPEERIRKEKEIELGCREENCS